MKKRCCSRRQNLSLFCQTLLLLVTLCCPGGGGRISLASASSSSAGAAALQALKSLDGRFFIAGGTCAAISHGITTPIDVVKTRIQADPTKYQHGMSNATVTILREEGPQTLLAGLGPTVVGYGIEGAMKFGVYEVMKPVFTALLAPAVSEAAGAAVSSAAPTPAALLLSSVVAGAVAALILCPMESTRIRIVTDPEYADKGLLTGLPKLIADEGLWSSFSGLWAMLAKQVPYTFGKQVSFDVFATLLYAFFASVEINYEEWLTPEVKKWLVSLLAAACASIFACIFSQPGDMILTETYRPQKRRQQVVVAKNRLRKWLRRLPGGGKAISDALSLDQDEPVSTSLFAVTRRIYQRNGLATFFTGTGARIVHVGLIITTQLMIYDLVKQLLGLPATGSH